ncbi:unnamed protein product [Fasciola hepatica]|uniref:Uncharacterized protein n=1 Tax=Fasciola hepatica TaxID=6192 RepID=A0ABC9HJ64_FASHE
MSVDIGSEGQQQQQLWQQHREQQQQQHQEEGEEEEEERQQQRAVKTSSATTKSGPINQDAGLVQMRFEFMHCPSCIGSVYETKLEASDVLQKDHISTPTPKKLRKACMPVNERKQERQEER